MRGGSVGPPQRDWTGAGGLACRAGPPDATSGPRPSPEEDDADTSGSLRGGRVADEEQKTSAAVTEAISEPAPEPEGLVLKHLVAQLAESRKVVVVHRREQLLEVLTVLVLDVFCVPSSIRPRSPTSLRSEGTLRRYVCTGCRRFSGRRVDGT